VLYVHPFAEEMNKSRRMAALQARAMAAAGYAVLQLDLLGCGDSGGDFAEATWPAWMDDVHRGLRWLDGHAEGPLWLWGLRAGCLLTAQAARELDAACNLLWWQPPGSGSAMLQQFLRLHSAAAWLGGGERSESPRRRLARGETVEVAGYPLSPSLASGLEQATLELGVGVERLEWLELSPRDDATLSPAVAAAVARWQAGGVSAAARVARGPAFWHSVETEVAPALLEVTLAALAQPVAA
jgi:exosortase A-associated hydrolase 2